MAPRLLNLFCTVSTFLSAFAASAPNASPNSNPQNPLLSDDPAPSCDCSGTRYSKDNASSICNDWRLGPIKLPQKIPYISVVGNYDRFGDETPGAFLKKWINVTSGKWAYAPENGFSLDVKGKPIKGNMTLTPGTQVDRFGSERGNYVAAAEAPFDQRSLPPDNLNCDPSGNYPYNYHVYEVVKNLTVEGGPVAPWFGQPGLGAQFYVGAIGNIQFLKREGYLKDVPLKTITPGPLHGKKCGM